MSSSTYMSVSISDMIHLNKKTSNYMVVLGILDSFSIFGAIYGNNFLFGNNSLTNKKHLIIHFI